MATFQTHMKFSHPLEVKPAEKVEPPAPPIIAESEERE